MIGISLLCFIRTLVRTYVRMSNSLRAIQGIGYSDRLKLMPGILQLNHLLLSSIETFKFYYVGQKPNCHISFSLCICSSGHGMSVYYYTYKYYYSLTRVPSICACRHGHADVRTSILVTFFFNPADPRGIT